MIEFFHTDEESRSLTKLDTEQPGCWIALFEPTAEELADVAERFAIDADDLRAPLDLEEVSRIETGPAYTMFIVDTPIRDKSLGDLSYKTIPIAIFETRNHVVSVCSVYKVPIVARLMTARGLHDTGDIKGFTCDILMASSAVYFALLQTLNHRRIELNAVTTKPTRGDLEELYSLDASLVYMKTSLATNNGVFERYQRRMTPSYSEEDFERFDDVVVENRQALETTNLYSEILDSTIDHFGLIMDYDLNHTMQLVATITLVLCVPTIVGGFFGMNLLGIPLAELPYGFAIVTGLTVVVLAALLLALKKLKWF